MRVINTCRTKLAKPSIVVWTRLSPLFIFRLWVSVSTIFLFVANSILQNKLTNRHLILFVLVKKIAPITHFALALHEVDADLLFPLGVFYFVRV
jgi:hypothetical protein